MIRVLLADDHQIVREGLKRLLECESDIEVIAEAGDVESAVALTDELQPDVVLMDVSLPDGTGMDATRLIKQRRPEARVIGLSMHEPEDMAAAMLAAGACTYVSKSGPTEDLLAAIRRPGSSAA